MAKYFCAASLAAALNTSSAPLVLRDAPTASPQHTSGQTSYPIRWVMQARGQNHSHTGLTATVQAFTNLCNVVMVHSSGSRLVPIPGQG